MSHLPRHALSPSLWRITLALSSVVAVTATLWVLQQLLGQANLLLCYVPLVLLIALRLGRTAAVLASIGAFLAYNFLFVPPLYTLTIEQPQDLIELIVFLAIALLTGALAARQRALALAAAQRAEYMSGLYRLSQQINATADGALPLRPIVATAREVLDATGVEIALAARSDQPETSASAGVCQGQPEQRVPITVGGERWGELRLWGLPVATKASADRATFITTIANQIAVAVERAHAAAAALQSQALREADRLKSALLSSVSHDLRTPLAVIKGAATNLLDASVRWDPQTQQVFAETIVAEADRLNRLMRNLLEMSRLEAGTLRRQRTPVEVGDVIVPTAQQLRAALGEHPIEIVIAPELPLAPIDAVQIELVLTNLLENAAKFAPAGTPIDVRAELDGATIRISVADRGPGIPPGQEQHIFEKFYRLAGPEQGPGGTGLGLAICQGIVEAHGGRIWATNRPDGGAIVSFTLPVQQPLSAAPTAGLLAARGA